MTLPPERISIKRRRQDEPVDTLILEAATRRDPKRRFTDFYFQRLRHKDVARSPLQPHNVVVAQSHLQGGKPSPARDYQQFGIPVVKASAVGDEVKDFAVYKAAHKNRLENKNDGTATTTDSSLLAQTKYAASSQLLQNLSTRRFHLMRDLSATLGSNPSREIPRPKINLRPPLATFMERQGHIPVDQSIVYAKPPVDNIVELGQELDPSKIEDILEASSVRKRTKVDPFQKSSSSVKKSGQSIRDDPTTWDYESDQLANELAALAFDIDPADATEPPQVKPATGPVVDQPQQQTGGDAMVLDSDNDFVFETYIRIKHDPHVELVTVGQGSEVGVLVIDDETEDLWEKYINSDDDEDDWDEEDEDSNAEDNPRNDYPDDEVSTDDEHGRNLYKYRRHASDDEEYYDD